MNVELDNWVYNHWVYNKWKLSIQQHSTFFVALDKPLDSYELCGARGAVVLLLLWHVIITWFCTSVLQIEWKEWTLSNTFGWSTYDRPRPVATWLPGPNLTGREQYLCQKRAPFFFGLLWFSLALVCQKQTPIYSSGGIPCLFCLLASKANPPTLFNHKKLPSYMTKPFIHIRWRVSISNGI